jgi:hypothetical protein
LPVKHELAKTLKSVVCLFILPYPAYAIFTLWPYFSIYYSCVYNAKMNLWLNVADAIDIFIIFDDYNDKNGVKV